MRANDVMASNVFKSGDQSVTECVVLCLERATLLIARGVPNRGRASCAHSW